MNRVIPFLKFRYFAFAISIILIIAGIGVPLLTRGFNWGMDFTGGFSAQVRIAPVAFTLTNQAEKNISISLSKTEIYYAQTGGEPQIVALNENQTIQNVADLLAATGLFQITPGARMNLSHALIFNERNDQLEPGQSLVFQIPASAAGGPFVGIDELRTGLLDVVGSSLSIQQIGDAESQQYMIRLGTADLPKTADGNIDTNAAVNTILSNLEKRFGAGSVLLQSKESLAPQTAQSFASGSIIAIVIALAAMLLYVSLRFRLNYAVAAVIALIHDVCTASAFVAIFQIEINTAVIAALLTIIGFSINDTIVIYDRIRENEKLLKGRDFASIINVSLSQTLGRTLITSLVVFFAVFPLYIFGSGPVKDFSFTMVFGIVTGTYSSLFIASPIVLAWQNALDKARRRKELKLFGRVQTPAPEAVKVVTEESAGVQQVMPESVSPEVPASTGPIVRVQRVLEKKKKKKQRF